MKTNNELIAEFLGWKFTSKKENWKKSRIACASWTDLNKVGHRSLFFQDSWDWLMLIVENIENIRGLGKYNSKGNLLRVKIREAIIDFSILPDVRKALVHTGVVEFIKWYNQQSK